MDVSWQNPVVTSVIQKRELKNAINKQLIRSFTVQGSHAPGKLFFSDYPEHGGSSFIHDVSNKLPMNTTPYPRKT